MNCEDCKSVYIGQSEITLKQRVGEHIRSVNNNEDKKQIYKHVVEMTRNKLFLTKWKSSQQKRGKPQQTMEALHTKLNTNSINKTLKVPRCYQVK